MTPFINDDATGVKSGVKNGGLNTLYLALAEVFNGPNAIDDVARAALTKAASGPLPSIEGGTPLPQPFLDVMAADDAHDVCRLITQIPFTWTPPQTSTDPLYIAHSVKKAHVELVGPNGLCTADHVRIGLYGILPHTEYGIRTHAAEETFKMLAGEAYWIRGTAPYRLAIAGEESYHPSMLPHATKTAEKAFMSIYVWAGDVSLDSYDYQGIPA